MPADQLDSPLLDLTALTTAELEALRAEIGYEMVRRGEDAAGIYEWVVPGVGVYIGQAQNLITRRQRYVRNVARLRAGEPYSLRAPDGYRDVHRAMAVATEEPVFRVLERCPPEQLNARERHYIALRRTESEAGGLPVLNGKSLLRRD